MNARRIPELTRDRDRGEPRYGLSRYLSFNAFDSLMPNPHSFGRSRRPNSRRVNGCEVFAEIALCAEKCAPKISASVTLCEASLDPLKLTQCYPLYVRVKKTASDRRRLRATSAGVVDRARVDRVYPTASPRHRVSASGATHELCEQRRRATLSPRPWSACEPRLQGIEGFRVEDRLVCVWVGVAANPKLSEIDAIVEHRSHPARCHPEPVRDLHDRDSCKQVPGRSTHLIRLLVTDETACVGVARVAARRLSALPDPIGNGCFDLALKSFSPLLKLVLVNGGEEVSVKPSCRRGAVDVLPSREHHASGPFDLIPQVEHQPKVTTGSREVGDHDAAKPTGLHPVDGLAEDRAIGVRPLAVELRVEHPNLSPLPPRPVFYLALLVNRRAECLPLPGADEADPHVPCQWSVCHGRGPYRVKRTRGTRRALNAIYALNPIFKRILNRWCGR
jgi:hypothetical protein